MFFTSAIIGPIAVSMLSLSVCVDLCVDLCVSLGVSVFGMFGVAAGTRRCICASRFS